MNPPPPSTGPTTTAAGPAGTADTPAADAVATALPGVPSAGPVGRPQGPGQFREIWRRYRRNKLAMAGLVIVAFELVIAIISPFSTPYDPFEQNLLNTLQPPSAAHFFGTDVLGRDLYSGVVYGTRLAMIVGVSTVLFSLVLGLSLGALAGFKGGLWDAVIARIIDIFLAFPALVGAIVIVRATGNGVVPVVVALVALGWMTTARLMRGQVLALREAEYVEAARSIGAGTGRILRRHILPNAVAPVLVYSLTSIGVVVVAMASLSYLGVGVPPDVPEWGRLISTAAKYLSVDGVAHLWFFPSLAIMITTLGFAFVGDGLRDALDPKLRGGN
ncbi:ABC transporter permease [Pseudonocardia spirodelae]|uniref:ABC transporter permease n=1 Tax=Pseudonocardia spirodelae TaxID=3133431 RepID=A0ABU8T972_9PSEU